MAQGSEWWLITVPVEKISKDRPDDAFEQLKVSTASLASTFRLQPPQLKIGTLDSLMSLSDELGKHDTSIEMVIRKIERQYGDLAHSSTSAHATTTPEPLAVGSAPPSRFLENFSWQEAKYSPKKPLPELVSLILSFTDSRFDAQSVGTVDEELRQLSINLTETTQRVAALSRKKGGNLSTNPIEEFLKPEMTSKFVDSEYLRTVCIVVPKASESEFLSSYHQIGSEIAGFNSPDWSSKGNIGEPDNNYGPFVKRMDRRGSPVVPGSAVRLLIEGDYVLYTILALKGQYEAGYLDEQAEPHTFKSGNYVDFFDALKTAAREKRYIVREYKKTDKTTENKNELAELEVEVGTKQTALERWCRTHFGEAFSAWIHLKVIRAFVESVLRYGISGVSEVSQAQGARTEQQTNFVLAALKLNKNKGFQLKSALDKLLQVKVDSKTAALDEGEEGEYHEYCKLEFTLA